MNIRKKERTNCRNGHEMDKENSYLNKGYVLCRKCRKKALQKMGKRIGSKIKCAFCGKIKFIPKRNPKFCSPQCAGKSSPGTQSITHGKTYSPEYAIWCHMKSRCGNSNHKDYKYYGGRGIKVCKRWLDSFENFFADMELRPSPKHSIDRINNNGNYKPSNCRWVTMDIQARNRRILTRRERNDLGQFKPAA